MTDTPIIDTQVLREQVRDKYRAVAVNPDATYHFHTGRSLADRLGYDPTILDTLPDRAVESFAGVANRSRCGRSSPANASSTSAPAPGSTASSPPTTSDPTATSSGS